MVKIFNKIIGFADEISTRPNFTSWKWKGNISILSFVILYLIYFIRLCSLLQISKFIYRKLAPKKTFDHNSQRVNVPPYFVELYFIIWAIVLFLLPKDWPLTKWLSCYFLFESFFWLLYYFFFRRFYEEKYAIMHILEYIVLLPLLILIQARAISVIYHYSFRCSLVSMFFPGKSDSLFLLILCVIYTALIIGIVLSYLPIENVKEKSNYRFHISIIGNGFIVKERLMKAIDKYLPPLKVAVFDLKYPITKVDESLSQSSSQPEPYIPTNAKFQYFSLSDATSLKHILSSNIVWIATPSYAHFNYIKEYINRVFLVIEKPLVTNSTEMAFIKQLRDNGMWSRVFCLSYYYLEKALPLTYLYSPLSFYEQYLDFDSSSLDFDTNNPSYDAKKKENVLYLFEKLGKLKKVELTLNELADERSWVNNPQYGGHIYETFLHLAVLARMAMGEDTDWGVPLWNIKNKDNHFMSYIHCKGVTKETSIEYNLIVEKFKPEKKRWGRLEFDYGHIDVSFDHRKLDGTLNDKSCFCIKTKAEYETDYSIQLDMVKRCFEENIMPFLIDGSVLQVKTLEWLFSQKNYWLKSADIS